jgi:hypothetical protein
MLESKIQSKIIDALIQKGCYVAKIMKSTKSGVNDLLCCVPTLITKEMVGKKIGVFYSIEVKNEDGDILPLQEYNQKRTLKAGGKVALVRSVADALEAIK